jgi:hypothetical protein
MECLSGKIGNGGIESIEDFVSGVENGGWSGNTPH